jgi:Cu(I)/Ag(I) efflux system protein CusF
MPRRIMAFARVAGSLALLSTSAMAQDPRSTAAPTVSSPSIAAGTPQDPADPAAAVPNLPYRSAWSDYRPFQPQTTIWKPGIGDVSATAAAPAEGQTMSGMPGMKGTQNMSSQDMEARRVDEKIQPPPPGAASATTVTVVLSDTRGVIQAINQAEGKVKLKHGPIPKLSMPAMTMVYRVQDPKLLKEIKEGDEVGVTVEKVDETFVITGFQK